MRRIILKHVLLGLAVSGAGVVPGGASELLPTDEVKWNGFYVGGQLGGAWSDTDWRYENHNWFNTLGPVLVISDFNGGADGVLGGGQFGFNYQTGPWVLGIAGSMAGADLEESIRSPFFPAIDVYTEKIDLIATVTGQLGYAFGPWLAYGKAGWAGADVDLTLHDRETPVRASGSNWTDGWTVGAGGAYALGGGFSLALEYDYTELDTDNWILRCPTCPSGVGGGVPALSGDITVQSVTGRLNYRFGGD